MVKMYSVSDGAIKIRYRKGLNKAMKLARSKLAQGARQVIIRKLKTK